LRSSMATDEHRRGHASSSCDKFKFHLTVSFVVLQTYLRDRVKLNLVFIRISSRF
jgi:hypothetical protein